jgi:hypothetical protein
MKPEGSLPCSQEPATDPYSEQISSNNNDDDDDDDDDDNNNNNNNNAVEATIMSN